MSGEKEATFTCSRVEEGSSETAQASRPGQPPSCLHYSPAGELSVPSRSAFHFRQFRNRYIKGFKNMCTVIMYKRYAF